MEFPKYINEKLTFSDKPILFLDFDGVVNTRRWQIINGKAFIGFNHEEDNKVNDIESINWINYLHYLTNLKIVVISS